MRSLCPSSATSTSAPSDLSTQVAESLLPGRAIAVATSLDCCCQVSRPPHTRPETTPANRADLSTQVARRLLPGPAMAALRSGDRQRHRARLGHSGHATPPARFLDLCCQVEGRRRSSPATCNATGSDLIGQVAPLLRPGCLTSAASSDQPA